MRIAWLGPAPSDDPGVPTVATLLIEGLANAGVEIDIYCATGQTQVSPRLRSLAGVSVEDIHRACCERFPAGDAAAFEATVRTVLAQTPADLASTRASARTEAVSRFDHLSLGSRLAELLDRIARAGR